VENVKSLSTSLFGNFKIGTELLIYNGILTYIGLWIISKPQKVSAQVQSIIQDGHR